MQHFELFIFQGMNIHMLLTIFRFPGKVSWGDSLKTHVGQFLERLGTNSVMRGGSGVITRVVPSPFKKTVTSLHPRMWKPPRKIVCRAGWQAKHAACQRQLPFPLWCSMASPAQCQWIVVVVIAHVGILLGIWGHLLKRFACESIQFLRTLAVGYCWDV